MTGLIMNCLCIQAREWLASQQFTPEQVKVVEMRWNAVNKYPDKAQTMRDAFERADFANDGSLSRAELVEMLRSDADVIALLKTPEPPVEFDSSFAGMGADETSVIAAEFVQHLLEVIGVNALDGIEFNVEGMESLDIEALRLELFPEAVAAAAAAAAAAQDEADGAEVKTWLDETVGEVEEIHAGVEALLSDVEEVAQAMDALLVAAVKHHWPGLLRRNLQRRLRRRWLLLPRPRMQLQRWTRSKPAWLNSSLLWRSRQRKMPRQTPMRLRSPLK